ncbi:FABP family protein [Candidatus Blastococcus massiliensis]|uniref:FABP family protein n=1 Tax=Candidatus Blastococcus massiliensis TaxID=1470358 RepID=UPI0004ACA4A4|nr:FABP family protein [Candidatus Blastococcus massiliensis]
MSGDTELPVPDTSDVRSGPEVSDALLSVLPLLGEWHGEGVLGGAVSGSGADVRFGQWVRFTHDGRGFLAYDSRTWRLTDDGQIVGPDVRESGFWRPRGDGDDVELLVVGADGLLELYVGSARTTTSWELATDMVARTPDAPEVTRAVRLYGIVEGALMYAVDRAVGDGPLRPTMSARLERIR